MYERDMCERETQYVTHSMYDREGVWQKQSYILIFAGLQFKIYA